MKITETDVWGFKGAFRGMRNPLDSWDKSDSHIDNGIFVIGSNDLKLAQTLIRSGNEHCKFLRMIHVQVDVDMPRYFWSEADTYHFGTKNSRSTMHKLLNSRTPITKDMFVSCEEDDEIWDRIVERLEKLRMDYKSMQKNPKIEHKEQRLERFLVRAKRLLPEGFEQMRTWDTNYAELRNMYFQRRNHRLKEEWRDVFCKWVESLPYAAELITYEG